MSSIVREIVESLACRALSPATEPIGPTWPGAVVAIVSYNTRELLRQCLQSLLGEAQALACRVVVVDNASTDGSAELVRHQFPSVQLIALPINVGFARANNIAFARCANAEQSDFLLLNSDTVMPVHGLTRLLRFAQTRQDIGAFTCFLHDANGQIERNCFRLPRLRRRLAEALALHKVLPELGLGYRAWPFSEPQEIECATGAVLLVRGEVWRRLGGLEEGFFMYHEDIDFCWRLAEAGVRMVFWPGISILHYGGASSVTPTRRLALQLRAQTLAYRTWYGSVGAAFIQCCEVLYAVLYSMQLFPKALTGKRAALGTLRTNAATVRWVLKGGWWSIICAPENRRPRTGATTKATAPGTAGQAP